MNYKLNNNMAQVVDYSAFICIRDVLGPSNRKLIKEFVNNQVGLIIPVLIQLRLCPFQNMNDALPVNRNKKYGSGAKIF